MKYTQIPATAFKNIQMNAGILVDEFTPATGVIGNIIGATSGGTSFTATASYLDYADDVDNAPKNLKEFKKLESWEAKLSGTFISVTQDLAKLLVGAGDDEATFVKTSDTAIVTGKTYYTQSGTTYIKVVSPSASSLEDYYEVNFTKVIPRNDILSTDFTDIWWVGDYSDANTGDNAGFCAIHVINALSTGGFQLQSADKGKGQFGYEFTGHYSTADTTKVPFEIYIKG